MNVIVCIDDNNGMLFGDRRQSRDVALCERVLEISKNSILRMNGYSYELFENLSAANIKVNESFLKRAKKGDFCFIENQSFAEVINDIEKVIVYRWNRSYPSDVKFDIAILDNKSLLSTTDFIGNSHEKITEEVYG